MRRFEQRRKRHFKRPGQMTACGLANPMSSTSVAGPEVTCKRCLHQLNRMTTGQGGPGSFVDVVLTVVGLNWINVIKVVREVTAGGLKESKDLVDGVRGGTDALLFEGVTTEAGEEVKQLLLDAGATAELRPNTSGVRSTTNLEKIRERKPEAQEDEEEAPPAPSRPRYDPGEEYRMDRRERRILGVAILGINDMLDGEVTFNKASLVMRIQNYGSSFDVEYHEVTEVLGKLHGLLTELECVTFPGE